MQKNKGLLAKTQLPQLIKFTVKFVVPILYIFHIFYIWGTLFSLLNLSFPRSCIL